MGIFTGKRNSNSDDQTDDTSLDEVVDLSKNWEDTQKSLRELVSSSSSLVRNVGDELIDDTVTVVNGLKTAGSTFFKNIDAGATEPFSSTNPIMDALSYNMQDDTSDIFPFSGSSGGFSPSRFGPFPVTIPSVRKYDTCINNDGLSVWDRYGAWRCLLPKSQIDQMPEMIKKFGALVNKEDYLQNEDGVQSYFFQNMNDLLAWKSNNAKIEREKLIQQRQECSKKLAERRAASLQISPDESNQDGELKVVGTSRSISIAKNADGTVEQVTKTSKTFEDGTSKHEEIKKIINSDGTETSTKNEENVDSSAANWFWKK